MRYLIENVMGELYAIFFADHTVKVKEVDWLYQPREKNLNDEGRLDNEFGTYMRERLYNQMCTKK
jgi:hypothetical protein